MTERGARWRAAGALALVFLAGGGVGWAAGARSADARVTDAGGHRGGGGGGRGRGPRPEMLLDAGPIARYDLTPDQRTRVDSILGARRREIDAFWQGPGQALRQTLDAAAGDVRAVLTAPQQARFDSARTENQRRMRARFGGAKGPGPGPGSGPGGPPSIR